MVDLQSAGGTTLKTTNLQRVTRAFLFSFFYFLGFLQQISIRKDWKELYFNLNTTNTSITTSCFTHSLCCYCNNGFSFLCVVNSIAIVIGKSLLVLVHETIRKLANTKKD